MIELVLSAIFILMAIIGVLGLHDIIKQLKQ